MVRGEVKRHFNRHLTRLSTHSHPIPVKGLSTLHLFPHPQTSRRIICAVVAIFRLILPTVLGWLGVAGSLVMQVLNIILIAFVLIVLVYLAYDLLMCAGGTGMRVR